MHSVFFEPAGTHSFVATPSTAGPWSAQSQHGGPPSALAAWAMEQHEPDEGQRLARVTVDILRPVPVGKVTVRTRMVRPGRRVAMLEAVLEADGQEVLHARGWRLATPGGEVPVIGADAAPPPIPAPAERALITFPSGHVTGYLDAIDWRFVTGGAFDVPGPAMVWARPTIPLLPDEPMSPMCRALLIADSGSGVSATLDPQRFTFINVDLTVVLSRDPDGEWLLLDAVTTIGDQGAGLAETALSDRYAACGKAMQTLLVAPR
ncbi:MAG TPA: thioesterase family protein [Streptosporangiaceae bacterium]|nr:thioesterase family protein [Streptosporangiaceae bacterium]